jgi:hypothetical protein
MERRFNVRAFVVMRHELLRVVTIEVKHLFPDSKGSPSLCSLFRTIRLERNIRLRVVIHHRLQIRTRYVAFVCAYFLHSEILGSGFNQARELRAITLKPFRHFNCCDDVRFDSAHDVALDELSSLNQVGVCVLRMHPLNKARSRKARRINGEVRLKTIANWGGSAGLVFGREARFFCPQTLISISSQIQI